MVNKIGKNNQIYEDNKIDISFSKCDLNEMVKNINSIF